jgi:hypothetical protein
MKRCGGLRRQSGPEGENLGARGRQPNNEQRRGLMAISPNWLKFNSPAEPAVRREAEEDWGR